MQDLMQINYKWDSNPVKPRFYIEAYSHHPNVVMHCSRIEEAQIFLQYLSQKGKRWRSGDSYSIRSYWEENKQETCYIFGRGLFCDIESAVADDYDILEFTDFDWSAYDG